MFQYGCVVMISLGNLFLEFHRFLTECLSISTLMLNKSAENRFSLWFLCGKHQFLAVVPSSWWISGASRWRSRKKSPSAPSNSSARRSTRCDGRTQCRRCCASVAVSRLGKFGWPRYGDRIGPLWVPGGLDRAFGATLASKQDWVGWLDWPCLGPTFQWVAFDSGLGDSLWSSLGTSRLSGSLSMALHWDPFGCNPCTGLCRPGCRKCGRRGFFRAGRLRAGRRWRWRRGDALFI